MPRSRTRGTRIRCLRREARAGTTKPGAERLSETAALLIECQLGRTQRHRFRCLCHVGRSIGGLAFWGTRVSADVQSEGAPMNRDALCYESTVSLARRIRAGEVSPLDAVNAYLERIDRVDPRVHSYLHVAADHALQSAQRAEEARARGVEVGPLHGVPLAVKDLFDTAGMPTTCGSPHILGDNVSARSATAVERLERAGAVLLGKLHMTEFAFIAHHPDTPHPNNPWALDRTPGGSSSGSAIA